MGMLRVSCQWEIDDGDNTDKLQLSCWKESQAEAIKELLCGKTLHLVRDEPNEHGCGVELIFAVRG